MAKMEGERFEHFNDLSDEMCVHILSFVSSAPFENIEDVAHGSLTHAFPFISKRIYRLVSSSRSLWKEAIVRLYIKEPDIWKRGVDSLFSQDHKHDIHAEYRLDIERRVEIACSTLMNRDMLHNYQKERSLPILLPLDVPAKQLFQYIVSSFLRLTLPAFVMQGEVLRGEEIQLHFFEPRYRLLVREIINGYDIDDNGNLLLPQNCSEDGMKYNDTGIKSLFPQFVYAYQGSLAIGSPACIVELRQCDIFEDGRANVTLVPCSYVKIEGVWERRNSGGLYHVRCLRMGKNSSIMIEDVMRRHRRYWIDNANLNWRR